MTWDSSTSSLTRLEEEPVTLSMRVVSNPELSDRDAIRSAAEAVPEVAGDVDGELDGVGVAAEVEAASVEDAGVAGRVGAEQAGGGADLAVEAREDLAGVIGGGGGHHAVDLALEQLGLAAEQEEV